MNSFRGRHVRRVAVASIAAGVLLTTSSAALASDAGRAGSVQVLTASARVDVAHEQVTLPLLKGSFQGSTVWYVVTDDSDEADARARGLNYVPKLANALGTKAVQRATTLPDGTLAFSGGVDFSPVRSVVPGPPGNEFAGGSYAPGAVGDATYSPLVTTGDGVVLDATPVQNASGRHDSVVAIDTAARTVTLASFFGFWNGHRTVYLHQDASSPVVAAAEGSIYAPTWTQPPASGATT